MDSETNAIMAALERLPVTARAYKVEWVNMLVDAWCDAHERSNDKSGAGLTVDDPREIANALLLADRRSCTTLKLGGRRPRVARVVVLVTRAVDALKKGKINMFFYYCETCEREFPRSTVYKALSRLQF